MGATDIIIGLLVVGAFFGIIGSRVYKHEHEHLDPLIEKIKGWFNKDEEDSDDEGLDPRGDYNLEFRGKMD